jgi:hypothetical protein
MAAFTAQDVKALREKTGCGMMDCKKALTNADGDMDKAVDFLREQGLAKQAKKAGRIAAEGVAYACTNDDLSVGVVVEVNAETDFVAKNDSFMDFVKACANTIIEQNPADVEALLTLKATGSEQTIAEMLQEKVLTIGENIQIRRFERMEGATIPSRREYNRLWGLDMQRVKRMKPHAIICHPGPMNRGMEINADVADCARSRILTQVNSGVLTRMAEMYLLLGGENNGLSD